MISRDRKAQVLIVAGFLFAVAYVAPQRAHAQYGIGYGYGGYGYVPYGYSFGGGYGGYGGYGYGYGGPFGGAIGTTIYDQELIKEQTYALNTSRYNLQNARAEAAYSAANLMQQQAVTATLENQKRYDSLQQKYALEAKAEKAKANAERRALVVAHLNELIDSSGAILWPESAPTGGDYAASRQAVEDAVRYLYRAYKTGKASVSAVVDASKRLHEYGEPALKALRIRNLRKQATDLRDFLNHLDEAIAAMGAPPAPTA
jgi:hypothetical protein